MTVCISKTEAIHPTLTFSRWSKNSTAGILHFLTYIVASQEAAITLTARFFRRLEYALSSVVDRPSGRLSSGKSRKLAQFSLIRARARFPHGKSLVGGLRNSFSVIDIVERHLCHQGQPLSLC